MDTKTIRNSLSLLGVLGIGLTSWASVKCSRKADRESDRKGKLKAYVPAIVSGVLTSACVLAANRLSSREIAALAAGCAYMANREKSRAIQSGKSTPSLPSRDETIAPWEGPSIEWTGNGTLLCFEAYSGRLFYSSREAVERAILNLNEYYRQRGRASLNTFYSLLRIRTTTFGAETGWIADVDSPEPEDLEIVTIDGNGRNGENMLIIDIKTDPEDYWEE